MAPLLDPARPKNLCRLPYRHVPTAVQASRFADLREKTRRTLPFHLSQDKKVAKFSLQNHGFHAPFQADTQNRPVSSLVSRNRAIEVKKQIVAKAGIEPATPGFSVLCSTN